jgi:hypothetical protein
MFVYIIYIHTHSLTHSLIHLPNTTTQLMRDRRGWPRMPSEELAELRRVLVMGEEERARNLKAIHVRTDGQKGRAGVVWAGVGWCGLGWGVPK